MKCKQCGQDFPNLNALTQHKKNCGKEIKPEPEPVFTQPAIEDIFFDKEPAVYPNKPLEGSFLEPVLIPLSLCPEEIKLYALGHTVGLKLSGTYTAEGIRIQEVKLAR